ncbi:hypothetical protein C8R43DRAFT_517326 [Mycena crocata]|nr:hypothetical protein C8R43DRAFT_517326 [Mycena crocata]
MDVDKHGTGPIAHLDAIAAAIKHAELSPSAAAQPGELCRTQRLGHTCAIFNGFPPWLTGPPVAVFHAAFARFTEVWRGPLPELSSLDAGWIEAIARLLSCSKDHYSVKHKRTAAVKPCLKLLLPDGVVLEPSTIELDNGKSCQPDGNRAVASNIGSHLEEHNHFLRDLLFVAKNGDGQGGCDGEDQASHTYLNLCVQNTAAETRRRSVMPSLLLNLSQKHLEASGAVYLYTNPVCQRLAHISLVKEAATKDTDEVATVARFFLAVRECMALLKTHYEELTADSPLLPLSSFPFPHLTTVSDELTVRYDRWVFHERLGPRAVYFARRASDDRELVVKFAASYSVEAHQAAAQLGAAPPVLFADWHPKVQQFCIVMQRGDLGASHKDPELWRQLKRDLTELHRLGFVHGDIRLPNIVMDPPSGRLWILDWDWAGRVGEAKYPAALNPGDKRFPEGIIPCGDITVGDDDWMLDRAMGEAGIDLP